MLVKDILHRKGHDIQTVAPEEAIEFCAAHMRLRRVGALVVCEGDRKLKGIISERDIVHAVVDYGPGGLQKTAADYMDADPVTCAPDDTIASVANQMTTARVRHTPVCKNGEIVGLVSIGDIVKARFEELGLERDTIKDLASKRSVA